MGVLCAAGLRTIIDGIYNQEGIKNGPIEVIVKGQKITKIVRTLRGKIISLHNQGFIIQKHSDFLHEHRLLGNEALHDLENPSRKELSMAIAIFVGRKLQD